GGVSQFVLIDDGPPRLHPPPHRADAVLRSGAGIRPRRAEDYCFSGPLPHVRCSRKAMCGLLGILTARSDAAHLVPAIERALPCMRHRGPDEAGTWNDADVVFGFNRLSIIDLAHSHQPLVWGPEDQPDRYAM